MKKQTIYLICTFIIKVAICQDLASTVDLADYHFDHQQLDEAENLYRRALFFDTTGSFEKRAIEGLAWISYSSNDYSSAARYFKSLHTISQKREHYYYHILSLIKNSDWIKAKKSTLGIANDSEEAVVSKAVLLGLIAFQMGQYETAKNSFNAVDSIVKEVHLTPAIFDRTYKINKKSKVKAMVFSALLPGAGQAYSGHTKEAINSFVLVASIGTAYFYTLSNVGIIDALIGIYPWMDKYYAGGINRAGELVGEYKQERLNTEFNKLASLYGQYIR